MARLLCPELGSTPRILVSPPGGLDTGTHRAMGKVKVSEIEVGCSSSNVACSGSMQRCEQTVTLHRNNFHLK